MPNVAGAVVAAGVSVTLGVGVVVIGTADCSPTDAADVALVSEVGTTVGSERGVFGTSGATLDPAAVKALIPPVTTGVGTVMTDDGRGVAATGVNEKRDGVAFVPGTAGSEIAEDE